MVYECLLLQFLRTHSNIKVPAIKDTAYNLSGYLFQFCVYYKLKYIIKY